MGRRAEFCLAGPVNRPVLGFNSMSVFDSLATRLPEPKSPKATFERSKRPSRDSLLSIGATTKYSSEYGETAYIR